MANSFKGTMQPGQIWGWKRNGSERIVSKYRIERLVDGSSVELYTVEGENENFNNRFTYSYASIAAERHQWVLLESAICCPRCEKESIMLEDYLCEGCRYG